MPIIYQDLAVKNGTSDRHPSLEVNEEHPCYRMVREAIDGKSVFKWTREQAYQMYVWYCEGWNHKNLVDEFGEDVRDYAFQDILKKSYYLIQDPDSKKPKLIPSEENIEDLYAAITMEKKILEDINNEEEKVE